MIKLNIGRTTHAKQTLATTGIRVNSFRFVHRLLRKIKEKYMIVRKGSTFCPPWYILVQVDNQGLGTGFKRAGPLIPESAFASYDTVTRPPSGPWDIKNEIKKLST